MSLILVKAPHNAFDTLQVESLGRPAFSLSALLAALQMHTEEIKYMTTICWLMWQKMIFKYLTGLCDMYCI